MSLLNFTLFLIRFLSFVFFFSLSLSLSKGKVGNFGNIFLFYQYLRSRSVVNHKTYVGHASFTEYYSQRIASPYVENA